VGQSKAWLFLSTYRIIIFFGELDGYKIVNAHNLGLHHLCTPPLSPINKSSILNFSLYSHTQKPTPYTFTHLKQNPTSCIHSPTANTLKNHRFINT
jgi:hypothetical protein